MRQGTFVLLLLLVVFTSMALAAARGQAPAVGTLVICTGTGPIHILVDENGQPTGGLMVCPDYAVAFFADITAVTPDLVRNDVWSDLWQSHTESLATITPVPLSQPRGPPVSV